MIASIISRKYRGGYTGPVKISCNGDETNNPISPPEAPTDVTFGYNKTLKTLPSAPVRIKIQRHQCALHGSFYNLGEREQREEVHPEMHEARVHQHRRKESPDLSTLHRGLHQARSFN
jgi:hypothetical protein